MSWDEAFANHYDDWSAALTADVPFYVDLAAEATAHSSSLQSGAGASRSRSRRRRDER